MSRTEAFAGERRKPWDGTRGLEAVCAEWRSHAQSAREWVLDEVLPPTEARYAPLPNSLPPALGQALVQRGLERLYIHQAEAYRLASAGRSVVVATPTASGKSLAYNLPILEALASDASARALYVFPTKALARDQEEALRTLLREAGLSQGAVTYDGDTPADARRAAREASGVILTNPDMLHAGILPHHAAWARFFAGLRYVVLDELHTYRGVFGSHMANVLRRLRRVARFHGADPVFLCASATIRNPRAHAERLLGVPVEALSESGAPIAARRVMVYNPPVLNAELGIRASYLKASVRLSYDLVRAGVTTLVFGQSRNGVETMLKYLRDRLRRDRLDPELVFAYRGGYLPDTRRRIEKKMREGEIRCVVSTNALELGIDIGAVDAVLCAGYPGTLASLWQRFGRAGRRNQGSLMLLVTSSAPMDQYVAAQAGGFLSGAVEEARVDPDNVEILLQHLKCASFEMPFRSGEDFGDLPFEELHEGLAYLGRQGVLHESTSAQGASFHWIAESYPANQVSLRSVGLDNFVIIDLEDSRTLAEMDWRSTHTMLHEQAIYQHDGEQYQVERLDFDNHKAYVRRVEPDYYTDAMTYTKVGILEELQGGELKGEGHPLPARWGEVEIEEKVVGYKKIRFHTHENLGYGEVHLPPMQMHAPAFWIPFPEELLRALPATRSQVIDALRGLARVMRTVGAAGLMMDPRDLGYTVEVEQAEEDWSQSSALPILYLFERIPGGVGLAARLFDQRSDLLRRASLLLRECACDEGCPACTGPLQSEGSALPLGPAWSRKKLALLLLERLGLATSHHES